MDITISEELFLLRLGDAEVIGVALDPAQSNLSTLADNFTKFSGELQTSLSWHALKCENEGKYYVNG